MGCCPPGEEAAEAGGWSGEGASRGESQWCGSSLPPQLNDSGTPSAACVTYVLLHHVPAPPFFCCLPLWSVGEVQSGDLSHLRGGGGGGGYG